jgi:alpha-glucosidase
LAFWPNFKGRDGCRTPMPWDGSEHAGFSSARPWLPVPAEHRWMSVESQSSDRHSVLNNCRAFLRWRKRHPALRWGDIKFVDVADPVLVFTRTCGDSRLLAAFNLGDQATEVSLTLPKRLRQIESTGVQSGELNGDRLKLPPHGVLFAAF